MGWDRESETVLRFVVTEVWKGSVLGLFDPEDDGTKVLRNAGNTLPTTQGHISQEHTSSNQGELHYITAQGETLYLVADRTLDFRPSYYLEI